MRVCKNCNIEYDPTRFSARLKYCSAKCYHTKGMKIPLKGQRRGRPARFPKGNVGMKALIINELSELGWFCLSPTNLVTDDPLRFHAKKTWHAVKVSAGNGPAANSWAHAVAYYDADKLLTIASACVKQRNVRHVPNEHAPEGTKLATFQRIPCDDIDRCKACRMTLILRRDIQHMKLAKRKTG